MGAVARTQLRETPVMGKRTCVGLDVHARSVWACAVDDESGEKELLETKVPPDS